VTWRAFSSVGTSEASKLVQISPRLGVMVGRMSVVIRLAVDAVQRDGSQIGSRTRFRQ